MTINYRSEIDGLRAVAVIPVILFHAGFNTFSGGYVGVDIFFVISGYLITSIILKELALEKFSLIDFYERRARRILPALFFVILATLPLTWLLLTPDDMRGYSQSLVSVASFSSNIYFWMKTSYFDTASELKPLLHTWSLAVEEQYYIIFPVVMMLLWSRGLLVIKTVLITIFFLSFILANVYVEKYPTASFYLLHTRAWELMIGGLCALYLSKRKSIELKNWHSWISTAGFILIIISIFSYTDRLPAPSYYTLLPTMGASLIILFCAKNCFIYHLLSSRVAVLCGLGSYSAYLWHQPLIALAKYAYGEKLSLNLVLILLASICVLSYVSWKYVEAPFRDKKKIPARKVFIYAPLSLSVLVSLGIAGHLRILQPYSQELVDRYQAEPATRIYEYTGPNFIEEPHFVLYGDSFAIQYYGELQKQFGPGVQFTQPDCLSLPNTKNIPSPAVTLNEKCFNLYQRLIDYTKKYPVTKIFWAQSWNKRLINANEEIAIGRINENQDFFKENALTFIDQINKDTEIFILSHVPGADSVSDDMTHGYIKCLTLMNGKCTESYERRFSQLQEVNLVLKDLAATRNNLKYIHLHDTLCDTESCYVLKDDRLLYSDAGHLTIHGTEIALYEFNKKYPQ